MAANTRDIRRRIKSVKNTAQITKAMQMVAASKMRRAQASALAGRPYSEGLSKVLRSLQPAGADNASHPLLAERQGGKELVIVVATDKGLCGALNTNLLREVGKFDPANTIFVTIGRKAAQFLLRGQRSLLAEFELKDNFHFAESKAVSKFAMEKFLSGEVNKVTVAYTQFVNTLVQTPVVKPILPVANLEITNSVANSGGGKEVVAPAAGEIEYQFEPSASGVLSVILPHFVHFQVYQMVLDSRASEHSARMVAMKSATDNAKQLIKDLTLEYNKVRQASITTEILEIATAQMALS